jgi:hypothetical protein
LAFAAGLALVPAIVGAQDPRPPGNATLSGEVTDVNPLTVKVNGQEQLLRTAPDVVVNRDGEAVNLGELNKGDTVTFTTNPDDSVQRIDVTDPATDERTWLLIALLVVAALVIVGVVWYLTQRRGRDRTVGHDQSRPLGTHR